MSDLPITDIKNARFYAEQFIIRHRYDNQGSEKRWQLPPYLIREKPITDESIHIPPTLKDAFKCYTLVFDQEGCESLNCFRYTIKGMPCDRKTKPHTLVFQGAAYEVCQPACRLNWSEDLFPFIDEVHFVNGKCRRKNTLYKRWCLFPNTRSDDPNTNKSIPPFLYKDDTEECVFTPAYCDRFGLDYRNELCVRNNDQAFLEDYLIGKTIYRTFKTSNARPSHVLNRHGRKRTRRMADDEEDSNLAMVKQVAFDAGVEVSFWGSKQIALKTATLYSTPAIKLALFQLEKLYGKSIVKHAVVTSIIHAVKSGVAVQFALRVASVIGSTSTVVGLALFAIQLTGFVLDIVDLYRLKDLVDAEFIKNMKTAFENQLNAIFIGQLEIDPLGIMSIMSKNEFNEEEHLILITKLAEYFSHLKVNARGENLNYTSDLSIEEFLASWLLTTYQTPPEPLQNTMNTYVARSSVLGALLVGIFLAVSV